MNKLKYHALVLVASCLVAGSFIASEKLAHVASPLSLTLLRFLGSIVAISPFILFKPDLRNRFLKTMPRALVIGFFYAAYFVAMFEALKTTNSLNTGTLYTLVPFLTGLLSILFFKQRLPFYKIIVYFLGITGTVWVIFKGNIDLIGSFSMNHGDDIFLIAVLGMSLHNISLKFLYREDNMLLLVFCTLIGGSIWIGTALLLTGESLGWNSIQGESIYYMIFLIIGPTLITKYLYQVTSVKLSPDKVSAYIFLNPALVALILLFSGLGQIEWVVVPGIVISTLSTFLLQQENKTKVNNV
jgi:drug/metabolite transporter (DMT)-like permease